MKHDFGIYTIDSVHSFARKYGLTINSEQLGRVQKACGLLAMAMQNYRHSCDAIVAGGAVSRIFRKDTGGDIDVYTESGNTIARYLRTFGDVQRVGVNTQTITIEGIDFNIILGTCSDPDIILNLFDFNMVRLAIDPRYTTLYYAPDAVNDLKTETISICKARYSLEIQKKYPEILQERINKYARMGYTLSFDDFIDKMPLASFTDCSHHYVPEEAEDEDYKYRIFELLGQHMQGLLDLKHEAVAVDTSTPTSSNAFLNALSSYSTYTNTITPQFITTEELLTGED